MSLVVVNPTSASSPIVSARPSFTSSWPRFLKDSFMSAWSTVIKVEALPVDAAALRFYEFYTRHQTAFGTCLVLDHLFRCEKLSKTTEEESNGDTFERA